MRLWLSGSDVSQQGRLHSVGQSVLLPDTSEGSWNNCFLSKWLLPLFALSPLVRVSFAVSGYLSFSGCYSKTKSRWPEQQAFISQSLEMGSPKLSAGGSGSEWEPTSSFADGHLPAASLHGQGIEHLSDVSPSEDSDTSPCSPHDFLSPKGHLQIPSHWQWGLHDPIWVGT